MTHTPTRSLLTHIAGILSDNGAGVYKPTTGYETSDTAILMKTMPDKPDRCITLNWVPADTNPAIPHMTGILQVACRGNPDRPLDSDDLADTCDTWLDGLTQSDCGDGTVVNLCNHRNTVNMGQDDLKRWVTAVQYTVKLDVPGTGWKPDTGAWQ